MGKKILIVEDNELNMKLFRDIIEASGYETVRTRNGLEALDLARQHAPAGRRPIAQLASARSMTTNAWAKPGVPPRPMTSGLSGAVTSTATTPS